MIGAGDEEKMKKTKNIILYVILGVILIWLSFGIVKWVIALVKPGSVTSIEHIKTSI
jgi:Na+-driven multidrug efflux pump